MHDETICSFICSLLAIWQVYPINMLPWYISATGKMCWTCYWISILKMDTVTTAFDSLVMVGLFQFSLDIFYSSFFFWPFLFLQISFCSLRFGLFDVPFVDFLIKFVAYQKKHAALIEDYIYNTSNVPKQISWLLSIYM